MAATRAIGCVLRRSIRLLFGSAVALVFMISPPPLHAQEGDDPDLPGTRAGVNKEQYLRDREAYISRLRGGGHPNAAMLRVKAAMGITPLRRNRLLMALDGSTPAWQSIGPAPIPAFGSQYSGRVTSIAVHPTNANVVFLGTSSGGLFRTLDGGTTWKALMDDAQSLAIGSVVISPHNPTVVFVGTGEGCSAYLGDNFDGVGLYRIRNATGANPLVEGPFSTRIAGTGTPVGSGEAFLGASITAMAADPGDSNRLYLGTFHGAGGIGSQAKGVRPEGGLYFCENAMAPIPTFSLVGSLTASSVRVTDIKFDPGDRKVLLVAWQNFGSGSATGIWRSLNADAASVSPSTSPTFDLRHGNTGNCRLAVSGTGPTLVVYAAVENDGGKLWKSINGGGGFFTLAAANGFPGTQGFFNIAVATDPGNAAKVYLGGQVDPHIFKASNDGGATFSSSAGVLHADVHAIAVAPSNPSVIYHGNDGGIWKSVNGGLTWINLNNSQLSTLQYMSVATHPTHAMFTFGGTQDNGTHVRKSDGSWDMVHGGDGGQVVVDQSGSGDPFFAINTFAYRDYRLSRFTGPDVYPHWTDFATPDAGNFYMPLALGPGTPNPFYAGTQFLYRSADSGKTVIRVSQELPTLSAIGIAPTNDNVRLVGTNSGSLYLTTTGDTSLSSLTVPWPADSYIGRIAIDPSNSNVAYVVLAEYGLPAGNTVWKTTNLMTGNPAWSPSGSGLPDIPVSAMVIDPVLPSNLYVGTEIGVFASVDAGSSWIPFTNGMPIVPVWGVAIQASSRTLRVSTHGRGIWERKLPAAPSVPVVATAGSGMLGTASGYPAPASPTEIQAVDLNGDGFPDLTTLGAKVSTSLADSSGGFQSRTDFDWNASHMVVTDLNRDGRPDLVLGGGSIQVALGDGRGSFGASRSYAVPSASNGLAVADMNNDGWPDVLSSNVLANSISVLHGDGTVSLGQRIDIPGATQAGALTTVDVNADGRLDIVTTNAVTANVAVFLNFGSGAYLGPYNHATAPAPFAVVAGDVTGDGATDLVTASSGGTLSVLAWNSAIPPSYPTHADYVLPSTALGIALADMDADGDRDIVASCTGAAYQILYNDGSGAFSGPVAFPNGGSFGGLAVADFDRDGALDVAGTDFNGGTVRLSRSVGGSITPAGMTSHLVSSTASLRMHATPGYALADVNVNGVSVGPNANLDLPGVAAPQNVRARFASGHPVTIAAGSAEYDAVVHWPLAGVPAYGVAIEDMDLDGRPDLVSAGIDAISVLSGTVSGFSGPTHYPLGDVLQGGGIAVADLNHDNLPDIAAPASNVLVMLGRRIGQFTKPAAYPAHGLTSGVVVADLNGDGHPDLAAANLLNSDVSVLLGDGSGRFAAPVHYAVASSPSGIVAADLNGDGDVDLVSANPGAGNVSVLPGAGNGTFGSRVDYPVGGAAYSLKIADVNRDDRADVIVGHGLGNTVAVLLGLGGGVLAPPTILAAGAGPSVLVADLDGDELLDIASADFGSNLVTVRRGDGMGGFTTPTQWAVGSGPTSLAAGDVDLDGLTDLVVAHEAQTAVSTLRGKGGVMTRPGGTRWYLPSTDVTIQIANLGGYEYDVRVDGVKLEGFINQYMFPAITGAHRFSVHFRPENTGVESDGPVAFARPTVYPNPSRGRPTLGLTLAKPGRLQVDLFDVAGRRIRTAVAHARVEGGTYRIPLAGEDGARMSAGLYLYRAMAGETISTGRFVVVD